MGKGDLWPARVPGFPGSSVVKNPSASAGDMGSVPGLGRSPGGGNDNPLQYSCLGNHGQKSLVGYSPWVAKESDMTGQLSMHTCSFRKNGLALLKCGLFIKPWRHLRRICCPRHKITVWAVDFPEKKKNWGNRCSAADFYFCQTSALETNQNNIYWSLPFSSSKVISYFRTKQAERPWSLNQE